MDEGELTPQEIAVIKAMRESIPFETITIKKSMHGAVKRVTIHREHDIYFENKTSIKDTSVRKSILS
jgi:hypothetical protein